MFTKNPKGNDGGEGEIACSLWGTAPTGGRTQRARGRADGRAYGGRRDSRGRARYQLVLGYARLPRMAENAAGG